MMPTIVAQTARQFAPTRGVALGSLPFLLLEIERDRLHLADRRVLDAINIAILVAFTVDYVVEMVLVADRRRFVRGEWLTLLLIVSQAIAILPGFGSLGILRSLRAARALRGFAVVVRVVALGGIARREGRAQLRRSLGRYALGFAGLVCISSGVAFMLAEPAEHSLSDALWWSLATITTVGYGDIRATTPAGRLIGGFTMVTGISTFAVVTAKIAEFLVRPDEPLGEDGQTYDSRS